MEKKKIPMDDRNQVARLKRLSTALSHLLRFVDEYGINEDLDEIAEAIERATHRVRN